MANAERSKTTSRRDDARRQRIQVRVAEQELAAIKQRALESGLTVGAYLRTLGMGYQPPSRLDNRRVDALVKAMADLGRLGGLLKLWLSDDVKLAAYPPERRRQIPEVLQTILGQQAALREIITGLRG